MAGVDGMPLSASPDLLDLSLAPFFTACPNPFITRELDSQPQKRGAGTDVASFAADIAAGKNDPLYFAHYYSTKVPPDAIVPYILHYTEPGEVVFDGFCGTGMTGVAAQLCGDAARLDGRNYGARRAILSDLSPAAAFIAAGTNAIGLFAFHVLRGVAVPMDATEFYFGLARRFEERDGMYFLPSQATEYDRARMSAPEAPQLEIFIVDESSAIRWLRRELSAAPQRFQDLQPRFLREIAGWQKHERNMELSAILDQNFLRYDGAGEVPAQLRDRLDGVGDDRALRARAKDCWYVPDPNRAGDLEKLRERSLLKEFEEYRQSPQRRLKVFRMEAVRAGFKRAWRNHHYATIVAGAGKIPDAVLQEDPKLLMWYDQALTRRETSAAR